MFGEFFNSKSIDVARGVEIGIELERNSIRYYNEKSKEMESKAAADLLRFIEREEATHLKQLEELKMRLAKKKGWVSAEKLGEPKGVKFYKVGAEPRIQKNSGDVGILLAAARSELEAKRFYEEFSKRIKDTEGIRFFQRLAEFEQSHYQLFDGILEMSKVKVESADFEV